MCSPFHLLLCGFTLSLSNFSSLSPPLHPPVPPFNPQPLLAHHREEEEEDDEADKEEGEEEEDEDEADDESHPVSDSSSQGTHRYFRPTTVIQFLHFYSHSASLLSLPFWIIFTLSRLLLSCILSS